MPVALMEDRDGDTLLEAAVARPSPSGAAPAVLVAHGWAGHGENEHCIAKRPAELGYVGIAIDMFGEGVTGDPAGDNIHLTHADADAPGRGTVHDPDADRRSQVSTTAFLYELLSKAAAA